MYDVVLDSATVNRFLQKQVRCISGLRKGREGVVIEVKFYYGGGGLHVRVRFPNGAEHMHHVSTIEVVTLG